MKENLHFIGPDFKTGSGCLTLKKENKPGCCWCTEFFGSDKSAMEKLVNGYLYGHYFRNYFLGIKTISELSKGLCRKHRPIMKTITERILPKLKFNFL